MSCYRVVLLVLTGLAIEVGAAHAQSADLAVQTARYLDPANGIGLDEAVARAVAQEPSLRAARAEVDVSRGLQQQAALRPNPTVEAGYQTEPGGTDSQTMVGIQWPLDLFRRTGRTVAADRRRAVAEVGAEERQRMLVAEVRAQYGVAAAAIRAVAVADDLVNAAQRQFDIVRARVEAGAAPPLERDLLDVEVRRLDATRLLAIGRADAALVQLKPLLGMSPADVLTLRDTFDALVALSRSAFPGTEVQTVGARSDVREADARVALADARIDEARREGRLDFNLFGRYTRMDAGFPQLGIGTGGSLERVRGQFNYLSAGATVSVPLRDRNQGMVAAARAERVIAVARHEAVVLAASADLAAAQARSAQAQRAVALYDTGVRELASRNLDVVRQAFELGRATIYDVLAEQRRFLEVEEGYLAVARETWDAYIALSRAQGEQR